MRYLLLPVVLLAACQEAKPIEEKKHEATEAAPVADHSATTHITTPCAILYSPDSIQLERLKKEAGEEAFFTISEDYQNYISDAKIFLEDKGVKIIEATSGKLSFEGKGKEPVVLNLSDTKYDWNAWYFNGKELKKIDLTDIEEEYRRVMN